MLETILIAVPLCAAGLMGWRLSTGRLREEARAASAKLGAVLAGMPDAIMVLDGELRLEQWNAQFPDYVGVPAGSLHVGLSLESILRMQAEAGEFGPVDVPTEVERRMALFHSRASVGVIERKRPDGRTLELRRRALPNGGFVTLYTDISARRDAETQLRQAQKMEAVGQLTGGIAHDFNNLLSVVSGNLDLVEAALGRADVDRASRKLRAVRGGVDRASSLTGRLLAFARGQHLEPAVTDANAVITGMIELLAHSVGRAVTLQTELATGVWDTMIDAHQFENALLNLAINARDAMPVGGQLDIASSNVDLSDGMQAARHGVPRSAYVLVRVRDSGFGMTAEQAERVFEPFYTTKGGKGTGLGLPQVFRFVQQSNGHVRLSSAPGAGTEVRLYFPRHVREVSQSGVRADMDLLPSG